MSEAAANPALLRAQVEELQAEVHRLHQKLEAFHVSDYNSLQRAYRSLSQHVAALEVEAHGMAADLGAFETRPVPAELVAQELGVAAAITLGVGLLTTTFRALPLKGGGPVLVSRALWLLGAGVVVLRLTGGTLAHVAGMCGRNARRKRHLQAKLTAVEERIAIMAALQQWAERQQGPSGDAAEPAGGGGASGGAAGVAEAEPEWAVSPPRRGSPAASSGSSAEMVDMAEVEALEAAEAAAAEAAASSSGGGGGGGTRVPVPDAQRGRSSGGNGSGGTSTLQSLLAYAALDNTQRK